jgi:hypothetical protein
MEMSKYVTIKGSDLEFFKGLVRDGLNGNFGELNEIRFSVNDEAGMMMGANGYSSEYFGTVTSDVEPSSATAQIIESSPAAAEQVSTNGHREPEILGDIIKRMFPKGETRIVIENVV